MSFMPEGLKYDKFHPRSKSIRRKIKSYIVVDERGIASCPDPFKLIPM